MRKLASNLVVCALAIALVPVFAFAFDAGPWVAGNVSNTVNTGNPLTVPAGWYLGLNIPSPGSYAGAGVSFWRNDTLWLYAVNGDNNGGGQALGEFRSYNFLTNAWATLTADIAPRAWMSAGRIGTNIYAVGGMPNGATSWAQMTGSLRGYSITGGTWTSLTDAPTPTGSSGVVAYQDSLLYAIGGMGTTGQPITNVQLYNVTSGTWRAATALPIARANGWCAILRDTLYYGCGVGPATTNYNADVYCGIISPSDRATITWTLTGVTYPGVSRHRMDADLFGGPNQIGNNIIIGPGAGSVWWGTGTDSYIWNGGTSAFTSIGPVQATSDAMVGAGSYVQGGYRKWRFGVASGLVMSAPYHILTNQIYGDSLASGVEVGKIVIGKKNSETVLAQNQPNPAKAMTRIDFNLPTAGEVTLKVYDAQGGLVRTLVSGTRGPGNHSVNLDGSNLSSGVYFYRLQAGNFTATKKLVVAR